MISIVIPTLNEEKCIRKTITSFGAHFAMPHEIIISDGHSTDKTLAIARECGATVVEYNEPKRQTIAEGRNAGAAQARGEYLVFLDADCTIPNPDHFFSVIMKHFEADPKLVAVNVAIHVEKQSRTTMDFLVYFFFNHYLQLLNNVFGFGMAAGEFQMIRKDVFDKLGGYNGKLVASEDVDLFARLSRAGRVKTVGGLTIYHTGRRAHKIGWPKLLSQWIVNSVSLFLRNKAHSKEWIPIR